MRISVNEQVMEVPDGLSIDGLLEQLGVRREFSAVALNREVMPRRSYGATELREGDRIEIVHPMGGG
jgi:thiamine biosynthesis protein ThiS